MNNQSDALSIPAVITRYFSNPVDVTVLRQQLHETTGMLNPEVGSVRESAVAALGVCLESLQPQSAAPAAKVFRAIREFLVAWERLLAAEPTTCDADVPRAVFSHIPASMRGGKRWGTLFAQVGRELDGQPCRMSLCAILDVLDPSTAARLLKNERDDAVLASIIARHGDDIPPRVVVEVFRKVVERGLGKPLAEAFAKLKHRTIAECLPHDTQGVLGQALSRGVLAAVVTAATSKTLAGILKGSGSAKAVSVCLEERVGKNIGDPKDVAASLRAFFEGVEKYSAGDLELLCSCLLAAPLPVRVILEPLLAEGDQPSWVTRARQGLVNAALRASAFPEQRMRAIALLSSAMDRQWLDERQSQRLTDSVIGTKTATPPKADDAQLRFRFCDQMLACLEKAAERDYDRGKLAALVTIALGEFGMRIAGNSGETGAFDSTIHQTTLWGCSAGEAVVLQTDILRLDDAQDGPVLRRGKVLPLSRCSDVETQTADH